MTELFEQAIAKVRKLPDRRQDEAAELLLSLVEHDPATIQLSPEQVAEIERRLNDPTLTYATDEEVDALYRKLGA